ncbi:MAG: Holliday junction branch migration protein RuvA [Clostridia bacterium]|nr:Holliday junction branch migration protein RuvA [Clostridia bacterium]
MIYSLTGEIIHSEPGFVVIECGGVGFRCIVSNSTQRTLPSIGQSTTLYTYLNITQDAMTLFGFSSQSEMSCFKMLTSVSGIGSKTAIAVLSAMTPEQLAVSVASGDHKALTVAQGIGPKQAQRIVLELKDKVAKLGAPADMPISGGIPAAMPQVAASGAAEAIRALMVLGYSSGEASQMIAKLDQTLPVEQMISQALRMMAQ